MKTDGSDQNTKMDKASDEDRARKTMQAQIAGMAHEFERALPGKIGVERMMRIVMTAILKNPLLASCESVSFMGALLQALQLGLEVNTPLGQAYLIPRKKNVNGKFSHWECNFQIGYQGLLDLCYRFGKYKMITAEVAYEGDYFDYRYGTKQFLDHLPKGIKGAKPTHVWGLYELENGGMRFKVWTWEEAVAHGKEFSDSFDENKPWASPWLSNETAQEEMAKKSVLKALLKYAPKSVDGQIEAAIHADGQTLIAHKVDDGGDIKLSFDVKQITPPDPETQEMMNKVSGMNKKPKDTETVPASRGNIVAAAQTNSPIPPQSGQARGPAPAQGDRKGGLFSDEEAADLGHGDSIELPNFGTGNR